MIKEGLVLLRGQPMIDPAYILAEDELTHLSVSGQPLAYKSRHHLLMHKPIGLITAMSDERLPTIADLLPAKWLKAKIFPVGRLDRNTSGLLILTNDGTLSHRLAGPRWNIAKSYQLQTEGKPFSQEDIQLFAQGLVLADGLIAKPADLEIISSHQANLTITEGKYHQVKRMMLSTGRRVTDLHRYRFGPLYLDDQLAAGTIRELTKKEITSLYQAVNLKEN